MLYKEIISVGSDVQSKHVKCIVWAERLLV